MQDSQLKQAIYLLSRERDRDNQIRLLKSDIDFMGSIQGALVLGALIHWQVYTYQNFPNKDGWFFQTAEQIWDDTRVSEKTVRRIVRQLKDDGFLSIEYRRRQNGDRVAMYRLELVKLCDRMAETYTWQGVRPEVSNDPPEVSNDFPGSVKRLPPEESFDTPINMTVFNDYFHLTGSEKKEKQKAANPGLMPQDLPPWKTGRGPNDYNEDFLKFIQRSFRDKYQNPSSRADAIAHISKFQNLDTAYARWAEFLDSSYNKNKGSAASEKAMRAARESRETEESTLPKGFVPESILAAWRGKDLSQCPHPWIAAALKEEIKDVAV